MTKELSNMIHLNSVFNTLNENASFMLNLRQVMGTEVSNMGVEDLQKLENQLETSLQCIRLKKV